LAEHTGHVARVGKYELVRKLAIGGMSEVFLAKFEWAQGLEKTVVVKRMLSHMAEDPNFVAMFLSEARLASQLNHPNIIQILEFGESDGHSFLAMEYVDGPSLRTLSRTFQRQGVPLPLSHCARIVACCCEALSHAHELLDPATGKSLQLVHRDVSPDNILISRGGAVKLGDFGVAKAASQAHRTKTGTVKGKLSYMSPEQLRADPLDRRADIYSLGVLLYELVAGAKPFSAPNELDLIHAMLHKERIPLLSRRPDTPLELERIVNRALERDRELRYSDCRAMHADLEQFIISSRQPVSAFQIAELVRQSEALAKGAPPEAPPSTPEPAPAAQPPAPPVTRTDVRQGGMEERTDVSIELPFGPPDAVPEANPDADPLPTPIFPHPPALAHPPGPAPAPRPSFGPRAIAVAAVMGALAVAAPLLLRSKPAPAPAPAPQPVVTATVATPPPPAPPATESRAQELFERGRALLKAGDFREAQARFSECLRADAAFADCHLGLGSAYARLLEPEEGAEHYREYLRLQPNSARAGEVRQLLDSYATQLSAEANARPAPSGGAGQSGEELFRKGKALLAEHRDAEAEAVLARCVKVEASNPRCHLGLAVVYARQKKPDKSAQQYREFFRLAPSQAWAEDVQNLLQESGTGPDAGLAASAP